MADLVDQQLMLVHASRSKRRKQLSDKQTKLIFTSQGERQRSQVRCGAARWRFGQKKRRLSTSFTDKHVYVFPKQPLKFRVAVQVKARVPCF
jgi:hypothetical protein